MDFYDIQGLIDNTATIYTKIEILPKVAGEEIITLTNEDSIKSWVYSDLRNVEKEGFIGQFVARTLDGELQDIADDFNIEGREIVLYLGINSNHESDLTTQTYNTILTQSYEELITEQGDDILTYYNLGNFFVEKPESDEVRDNTKFQAMDYTILFNTSFNANFKDSEYTKSFNEKIEDEETVTALWLAQYTCKQVGVVLGTTTFRNSNFVISSNQFDSSYTCRDVVKSIAKLAFSWAEIYWDNKLYFRYPHGGYIYDWDIITNDNYYELTTQKDVYGEVNRVLTGSSIVTGNSAYIQNSQSIEDNGLTELDVYDNPILYTQELREQAVENASHLLGLMYQPLEVETTGHPWLLGNQLITVVDMEGNHLNTYPLDRILTYNGHIRSKISSITKTEMESTYSYQGVENNDVEIKRSRVELDRQNQVLTSVMERTSANESNISTITQNVNGISANVSSMSGNITNLQSDINTINNSITGISSDITDINGDVSTLQGNVTTINGNISNINSSINTLNGNVSTLTTNLNGLSVDFSDFYDNEYVQTIQDIQDQIDGVIEFWSGNDVPTLNNAPASSWTTEALKQEHIGDVYIVLSGSAQGANYRFVKDGNVWKWLEISDSQIGAVRELAQSAMDKANANESSVSTLNTEVNAVKQSIINLNSSVEDLRQTDVSLQADVDGISASYTTLSNHVYDLDDDVDGLKTGYDAITTAEKIVTGNSITINDCGEYPIKSFAIYGTANGVTGEHTLSIRQQSQTVSEGQSYTYDLDEMNLIASEGHVDYIYYNVREDAWYHVVDREDTQTETLIENDNLTMSLNNILDNAMLYKTTMIITDTANESGDPAQIKINYLTDTVFNAIYATRSDINVTKHSITSSVSETVTAVVENVDTRVTDVANTLEQSTKDLSGKINTINDSLGEYAKQSSLVTVTNSVQEIQTALNEQILVTQQIKEDGVEKVTTTTGFTFDQAGLTIDKSGSDTKTLVDEDGMTVYSKTGSEESILLNVDSQGVQTENLHVRTYTQIGSHTRLQDYEDGTAIFYIE